MIITNIYFGIKITLKIFENTILYSDLIKIVAYNGFQGGQKPILFIEEKNHTILIDLKKDSELLFKEFKTTTRNEINRAIKIGVRTEITDNKNEFILFYNKFIYFFYFSDSMMYYFYNTFIFNFFQNFFGKSL